MNNSAKFHSLVMDNINRLFDLRETLIMLGIIDLADHYINASEYVRFTIGHSRLNQNRNDAFPTENGND